MSKIFRQIKESLTIRQIVEHFGYNPNRTGFIHSPVNQERTPSCKLYYRTNTFYDFSSNMGGDGIKFTAAVLKVNNWQACQYLVEVFSLPFSLSGLIENRAEIEKREAERRTIELQKQEKQRYWRQEVDFLKKLLEAYEKEIAKADPFSDTWCHCMNKKQLTEYELDCICGIY